MMRRFSIALLLLVALPGVLRAGDPPRAAVPPSYIGYKRLTWNDYTVNDTAPGMSAQTRTFLRYALQARVTGSGSRYSARVASLDFQGGMDRANSWRRSHVPRTATLLLKHEQGHLTLNEIKLRQLKQVPLSSLPVGTGRTSRAAYANLQERLGAWYTAHLRDLSQMQNRYDRETVHGTRYEEQNAWSSRLDEALSELQ